MYGDYESLTNVDAIDALVDFTGGVAERINLRNVNLKDEKRRVTLFGKLKADCENKALMICYIQVNMTIFYSMKVLFIRLFVIKMKAIFKASTGEQ